MYICDVYESSLKFYYQKFSNNNHPFAKEYLLSWFLDLSSSYQAFNYRLNLMPEAISELVRQLIHSFKPQDCGSMKSLVDPMPIITCSGKNRAGKMSTEITSRGYYSTKNVYYFGLKLHVVAFRRKGIIPFFLKCLYFPLRMKMTQLYCIQKSKVWEIRTIEKYMPIKYIQIYYSIKRRKNAKNFRYLLL